MISSLYVCTLFQDSFYLNNFLFELKFYTASKEFKIGFFFSAPTKLEYFKVDINLKPCLGLGIDIWFSFMNDGNTWYMLYENWETCI